MIKSSDPSVDVPTYDSRCNTTSLGVAGSKTDFAFDSGDRNLAITETTATKTTKVEYQRDVTSRIISHKVTTNGVVGENVSYGFTGAGDSPDVLLDSSGTVKEKYFSLPGGVMLTVKVGDATAAGKTYSVPNMHGDVLATANASGLLVGKFVSGPFGEQVAASTKPVNSGSSASWQYVGKNQKLTENSLTLGPIQMGARVFLPSTGRFITVDPIDGGTENNYVYPGDPVNANDISGMGYIPDSLPLPWPFSGGDDQLKMNKKIASSVLFKAAAVGLICEGTAGVGCPFAIGATFGVSNSVMNKKTSAKDLFAAGVVGGVQGTAFLGAMARFNSMIKGDNNALRVGKGRVSIGPAKNHYEKGETNFPIHIHIDKRGIFMGNWKNYWSRIIRF